MGFFTKRERNELDKLSDGTMDEFVPQHQIAKTHREPTANEIGPLLGRAAGESVQRIDDLIDGLQSMRERLNREAARVHHEMIAYTRFSQSTLDSTKVISEGLRNRFPIAGPSQEPTLSPSQDPTLSPSEEPTLSSPEQQQQ